MSLVLQGLQLINILLAAQNHRGDLINQQKNLVQRTLDATHLTHFASTTDIAKLFP